MEDNKEDGGISFFDTIAKPEADNTLSITVYRKPTYMDQYLQWDSHHHLSAKYSVINTLTLSYWKYPKWAQDRVERRFSQLTSKGSSNASTQDTASAKPTTTEAKTKGHIVIPYTQSLCKSIKICSKYGIQTHFKGNRTIKNILVSY